MKITKFVTVETEVEVDVSAEDIATAFDEAPETQRHALTGLNNAAKFIKAITPEMIAEMGGARPILANFFQEQAARFAVGSDCPVSACPVVKRFGQDFHSEGGALTLEPFQVTETNAESGTHTRTHDSGWTITGELHEDYYVWVNDFTATHPELGRVEGNFEDEVKATSEEAFAHFWKHHQPSAWDYSDI